MSITASPPTIGQEWNCTFTAHANRQEWLTDRMTCIGASDSAAILGVGYANQSPITVWNSKVNGESDDAVDKRLTIGRLIEPALRAIFTHETGLPCESPGEFSIFRHPEFEWMGATLDGMTKHPDHGPCVVELKNVGQFLKGDWGDQEEPPLKFQIQIMHQLAVTGASHAFLMGLIGGQEPIVFPVARDEEFIAALIEQLREFWGYVERRELPPVDGSEATRKLLGRLWQSQEGKSILLPAEALKWAQEYERAKEDEKAAKARSDEFGNQLRAAFGDAEFGDIPGWGRYSYKTQTNKGYTVEPFSARVLRKCKK